MTNSFTLGETTYCERIQSIDRELRNFLMGRRLPEITDTRSCFNYMVALKRTLGNLHNSVSFLATMLAKDYLRARFGIANFDAAQKPQGAPGIDIETTTPDGKIVVCEIKTTDPYQPGFGAQQKTQILKDLRRLSSVTADYKMMFVTNQDTFDTLCRANFASSAAKVEIVDLLSGKTFLHAPGS